MGKGYILPEALRLAALGCDDAKWLGEIVLALANGRGDKGLDKGQRVVLSMCRAEIADRAAKREAGRVRKAKQRKGGAA